MANVLVHDTVTLPCNTSLDSSGVWYYQQSCDDFEHGMHICSSPIAVSVGSRYQIRRNAPGDNSLLINDVAKGMTGLYICKDRELDTIQYSVLLSVISKYNVVLFCHLYQ